MYTGRNKNYYTVGILPGINIKIFNQKIFELLREK